MGTTKHWTGEEAEAALKQVHEWIAWQGYVPLNELVWHGCAMRGTGRSSEQHTTGQDQGKPATERRGGGGLDILT